MIKIDTRIKLLIDDLIKTVPELSVYKGFGNCAYGSKLLHEKLKEQNIESKLLQGKHLTNSREAVAAKVILRDIISSIDDIDSVYSDIKNAFEKRGDLPKDIGHMVVLLNDDTCIDITSDQFGLPLAYSFSLFNSMWMKVTHAEIKLSANKDNFFIDSIKTKPLIKNTQGFESILSKWK